MKDYYEDIINLPHHVSEKHPQISMANRAAQFAPFAALNGHDEALSETARLTDSIKYLEEFSLNQLDQKFAVLFNRINENPFVRITVFSPDEKKDGGKYETISGNVKKIDNYEQIITLTDNAIIPIPNIMGMEIESNTDDLQISKE